MSRFGLLYEKLVVMPGQQTFPAYYMLVKRVLKEAKEDFPSGSSHDFGDRLYRDWYEKWFGVDKKDDEI